MSSCPHRWETLLTELSACLPAQSQVNSCLHLITQVPLPSSQDYKALSKILLSQLLSLPVSMWRNAERGDTVGTAVTRLPGYLVHASLHRGLWNDNISFIIDHRRKIFCGEQGHYNILLKMCMRQELREEKRCPRKCWNRSWWMKLYLSSSATTVEIELRKHNFLLFK